MSKIEWTEKTWNPVVGCSILSPGCTNCYAMRMAARIEAMGTAAHYAGTTKRVNGKAVWTGKLTPAPEHILNEPLKRKTPTMWFVNSMSDLFHEAVPDELILRVLDVIRATSHDGGANCGIIRHRDRSEGQHVYQLLTKRSARMREFMSRLAWDGERLHLRPDAQRARVILHNLWLGVSAERQQEADERIPDLLATPATVRWVSAEPLLGTLDLRQYLGGGVETHQAVGGDSLPSGGKRRVGDRRGGADMAGGMPSGERDARSRLAGDPLRSETGRETASLRLYDGAPDGRREAGVCLGASHGMAALQWPDPGRANDKSQEREEGRQPSRQLGAGDLSGAAATCEGHSEGWSSGSERRQELDGETYARSSAGDTRAAPSGREPSVDSGGLRDKVSTSVAHSAGRSLEALSWVVVGGESGTNARPMHPQWARSIRDQCTAAGVAFFFKQWGAFWPDSQRTGMPSNNEGHGAHVGKKAAGRLLDGRTWDEMPCAKLEQAA